MFLLYAVATPHQYCRHCATGSWVVRFCDSVILKQFPIIAIELLYLFALYRFCVFVVCFNSTRTLLFKSKTTCDMLCKCFNVLGWPVQIGALEKERTRKDESH